MKLAVNGFDMNCRIDGPEGAPWLTFGNSLVTSLEMWDEQVRALKDRYRVHFVESGAERMVGVLAGARERFAADDL